MELPEKQRIRVSNEECYLCGNTHPFVPRCPFEINVKEFYYQAQWYDQEVGRLRQEKGLTRERRKELQNLRILELNHREKRRREG